MKLGYLTFWLYDFFFNKTLSKTIAGLQSCYLAGRQASTMPLLKHAVEHVPYYSRLESDALSLGDFPVVNKDVIIKYQSQFFSDKFNKNSLIVGKTSGSNGVPFNFYWSKRKALSRTAEIIFHNRWLGYDVGDAHLLNAVGLKKSKLKCFLQQEIIANPREISESWLAQQRRDIIEKKLPFYIGYGSVIDRFSRYCESLGDTKEMFGLKGIISTAEQLPEYARARAEALFGCPVIRRYATLETGVLAHECPEERRFHVNSANYHIEFLKLDADETAQPGEVARIVVTDLNAFAMPLIRYDIGDLAIVDGQPCGCGRKGVVIKELTGRRSDSLVGEQGKIVSWIAISDIMWSFSTIEQFQVVQVSKNQFNINIVSRVSYDKNNLIETFRSLLGDSARVALIDVPAIDRLESGKSRFIINKMKSDLMTS